MAYAPRSQLNHLNLYNERAQQHIRLGCDRMRLYGDETKDSANYDKAINLMLFRGEAINLHADRRLKDKFGRHILDIKGINDVGCSVSVAFKCTRF